MVCNVSVTQRCSSRSRIEVDSGLQAGVFTLSTEGFVLSTNETGARLLTSDTEGLLLRALAQPDALAAACSGVAWSAQVELLGQPYSLCLTAPCRGRLLAVVAACDCATAPAEGAGWLDQMPVMVALLDAHGGIVAANEGLRRRLECGREEIAGMAFAAMLHEGDRPKFGAILEALAERPSPGPARPFDVRLAVPDRPDLSCALSSLRDHDARWVGAWVVLQDVGHRKQVERDVEAYTHDLEQLYIQLERRTDELQEANEALREARLQTLHAEELARIEQMKTAFLDVAAHELRTPVTLLTGLLD